MAKLTEGDESETPCDRCGKPRWKHHYFAGFGLLGGNGDHIYKPVESARTQNTPDSERDET